MRALITGGAGFVGHHLVEHLLKNTDWELVIFDRLTYAANGLNRLKDIKAFDQAKSRLQFYPIDIAYPVSIGIERELGQVDYIFHLAAETHVDNSILDPRPFVQANVIGTMEMLQLARRLNGRLKKFIYFSTDEVFGPAHNTAIFREWDRYNSSNPYSATKAAGEELCLAWSNTYGIPMVITHCMNAFGERQHPEKFIPLTVKKLLRGELITIHSDGTRTRAGSRSYIHCRNIAAAVLFLAENVADKSPTGTLREKFNITGEKEVDNLTLVQMIHGNLERLQKRKYDLRYELSSFHSQRPGHDLRYALDGTKLKKLGWTPPNTFETSLAKTMEWMVDPANVHWLMID
jgi:dTDP-glucose 4,6-dehydratase